MPQAKDRLGRLLREARFNPAKIGESSRERSTRRPTGGIALFVRLANPGEGVREIRLSGADLFGR